MGKSLKDNVVLDKVPVHNCDSMKKWEHLVSANSEISKNLCGTSEFWMW